ncbi:MAG: cbb3-type cytochrome c oxidase N-terminal domain-containing protein [Crocinitomicaceae bacterium]
MKSIQRILFWSIAYLTLFSTSLSYSQETEEAITVSATQTRNLYEKFGMTSTELFLLMMGLTLVLLIILIGIALNLKHVLDYKLKKFKEKGESVKVGLLLIGTFLGFDSFAASPTTPQSTSHIPFPDESFWILLGLDILLVMIILYLVGLMNGVLHEFVPPKKWKIWKKWKRSLTDAKPLEEEGSILMDHEYDGIRELDNNLPPWWKYGFYITIIWSVGYLAYYHLLGGTLQEEEYLIEMAEGERLEAQYIADHPELITIDNVELVLDASTLNKGRSIFNEFCVTCHMEGGAGGSGPNLTDEFWIYKGDIKGVFETIAEGADNGMKAWKNQLNGAEIQAVASYILQLDPILPPQGQAPKGENRFPRIIKQQ